MTLRTVVVGGGLAGIAAALRCADAGHQVLLVESSAALGGLTTSFRRGELWVDNGQHVFLRCCTSYRRLLDRLGVANQVTLQNRLEVEVRKPADRSGRLQRTGLPAPLHLGEALLRYRPLSLPDRLRAIRGALALRRLDRSDPAIDDLSFGDWLRGHGQSAATVEALWDLFTVATLNADADRASLALASMVFQVGLLTDAAAGDIGWSLVPLRQLHGDAARRSLTAAGGRVRTRARVEGLDRAGGRWRLELRGGEQLTADCVVLAVPPAQAARLLPADSVVLPRDWVARLGSAPIVNAHVVYDRRVLSAPFVAGASGPVQWVFDRTAQSGLTRGQYVAVSISAADHVIDQETATIRETVLPALADLLPAASGAVVMDFFVTRERNATFHPGPGVARFRPGARTRHEGLVLAGAWTDTGWPATMEGAVRSGDTAAAALDAVPVRPDRPEQKGSIAA